MKNYCITNAVMLKLAKPIRISSYSYDLCENWKKDVFQTDVTVQIPIACDLIDVCMRLRVQRSALN